MIWKGAFQPACLVAAVLFISGPTGCESPQPRPPVPTTPPITAAATIQIRVAVHLKDHIIWHEQIGDRDNIGCRLTEDEILAYLEELQSFATQKLGIGVQLQWNWPPDEFPDWYLVNRGLYTGMTIEFFRERLFADPGFDPGRINIYFTGWILPLSGPGNSQLGACLDPFCADALAARGETALRRHWRC